MKLKGQRKKKSKRKSSPKKEKQVEQRGREEVKNGFKKLKEIKGKNETELARPKS